MINKDRKLLKSCNFNIKKDATKAKCSKHCCALKVGAKHSSTKAPCCDTIRVNSLKQLA